MLIWSGWGIMVVVIAAIGLFIGISAGDAVQHYAQWAYGPSQSVGSAVGGVFAAIGIFLFARWREGGEPERVFIDEATGQRIAVRRSAGSLFFIPTRYWTWIVLGLTVLFAYSMFNAAEPDYHVGRY